MKNKKFATAIFSGAIVFVLTSLFAFQNCSNSTPPLSIGGSTKGNGQSGGGIDVSLNISNSNGGSGTVSDATLQFSKCSSRCTQSFSTGSTIILTAAPDKDSIFLGWSGDYCTGSTQPTCQFTVTAQTTLYANFVKNPTSSTVPSGSLSLAVALNTTAMGSVVSSDSSISCSSSVSLCQHNYPSGTSVTLTATPASGYQFASWTGATGCSTSPVCTFSLSSNASITANFSLVGSTSTLPASGAPTVLSAYYDLEVNSNQYIAITGTNWPAAQSTGTTRSWLKGNNGCEGYTVSYDGAAGSGVTGQRQVNVYIPDSTSALNCTFTITLNAQQSVTTGMIAIPAINKNLKPTFTSDSPYYAGESQGAQYITLIGTNFPSAAAQGTYGTRSWIQLGGNCSSYNVSYDGDTSPAVSGVRQVNLGFSDSANGYTCYVMVTNNGQSTTSSVQIPAFP